MLLRLPIGRVARSAVLLAVLACSATPDERPVDPPGPAPSGSIGVSSPPSTSPADLGALARRSVVEYYAEATRAATTGDVTRLRRLSVPSCPCRRLVTYIEEKWRTGRLRSPRLTLDAVELLGADRHQADLEIVYSQAAYDVLDHRGRLVEHVGPTSISAIVSLVWIDARYLVARVASSS